MQYLFLNSFSLLLNIHNKCQYLYSTFLVLITTESTFQYSSFSFSFFHSPIHTHIHTVYVCAALSLSHINHTLAVRGNLGFRILSEDTSAGGMGETGIKALSFFFILIRPERNKGDYLSDCNNINILLAAPMSLNDIKATTNKNVFWKWP